MFDQIKAQLADFFFETKYLGKEAIKQRVSPMEGYTIHPEHIQFIDWRETDNKEVIRYSFINTVIGRLLIANTSKGICFLGFANDNDNAVREDFQCRFPRCTIINESTVFQQQAADYCNGSRKQTIPLHLKGTNFQMNIWKQLVRIPEGKLSTYGSLAPDTKCARAIGSAVGANPVSYIIPCHRVVRNDGSFQGYHWGNDLKKQLLAYELQQTEETHCE